MRAAGPVVDPVPCSGCGKLLDPLRAGHVAIFDLRFHYFCDRGSCRATFLREPPEAKPVATTSRPPSRRGEFDAPIVSAHAPIRGDAPLPAPPSLDDDRSLVEPIGRTILTEPLGRFETPEPRDIGSLLLVIAVIAGSLAVALALAGEAMLVLGARIVLALVGAGMLVGRATTTPRDASDPHPAPVLASSIGALGAAIWAATGADPSLGSEAASLAGIIITAAAISAWLADSARRVVNVERAWIASALAIPGWRAVGDPGASGGDARGSRDAPSSSPGAQRSPGSSAPLDDAGGLPPGTSKEQTLDLRSGETVIVEVGEVVPVDLTVAGQEVEVYPWLGATTRARRRRGDAVVAGARVVKGRLRGVCTWAGNDRAFARLLLDPRRRADALAPIAQASRQLVEYWAAMAAVIGAISALVAGRSPVEIAMTGVAVHAALSSSVIATVASVHVARGVLMGLRRGIAYKSSDALDRAGRVAMAIFCARGTLLLGEPELTEIESPGGKLEAAEILALAAGAERAEGHPIATAIVRAARARTIRPDGVRNPNQHAGLGVTAVTSAGEELCVGNRALMLEQRISIAVAEHRLSELEAHGRSVVLVAVSARLVGILALQDGLRPGARAAVQHLLDAQIEPVLMSGDARETCEAIGRSLDIEHIRPEVLPADRSAEVRRVIDAGMTVAVLGHAGVDDPALGAADVAVALGAAGSAPGDVAIALASDDIRDAALALALARRTRLEARAGLALAVVPALIGSMAIAFGLLPPAYAPIAGLLGAVVAVTHVRALDRARNPPPEETAEGE